MPYTPKNGRTERPAPTLKTAWKLTGIGKMITAGKELDEEQRKQKEKKERVKKRAEYEAGPKRKPGEKGYQPKNTDKPMGKKKKTRKTYHYEYK